MYKTSAMIQTNEKSIISQWVRAGILFNAQPSKTTPDLERLLLSTAQSCESNPRLFIMVVTWLTRFGSYIVRHRLKHLIITELSPEYRTILALIIDSAIANGATERLKIILDICEPTPNPRPLFQIDQNDQWTTNLVRKTATKTSQKWGRWVQPFDLKPDALRTPAAILSDNQDYKSRAVRQGDLRASILEVLRFDVQDAHLPSESALARKCAANTNAIRKALDRLELEGIPLRSSKKVHHRNTPIAYQ